MHPEVVKSAHAARAWPVVVLVGSLLLARLLANSPIGADIDAAAVANTAAAEALSRRAIAYKITNGLVAQFVTLASAYADRPDLAEMRRSVSHLIDKDQCLLASEVLAC